MESPAEVTSPINLGNPHEFTIRQLAVQVLEMVGSKSILIGSDLPFDDPRQRKPDISLADRTLNWRPKVELTQGLVRTIGYFQEKFVSE